MRTIFIAIITISFLLVIWFNLPVSFTYYSEIKSGNQFIKNINDYKRQTGHLPKESDSITLGRLNPIKPYEVFYPEYRIIDNNNFHLTYIEGFDPPYLQYNTKTKKWEKK